MSKTKAKEESLADAGGNSEIEDLIKEGSSANTAEGKPLDKSVSKQPSDEINLDDFVEKSQYEEATKKIGSQGQELGEYRSFFKEISPLLDKLQEQPDLVEAIMEGKIDSKLAESVMAGKVKIEDATQVAEAHEVLKKELGEKKYGALSASEIEKLVETRVKEHIVQAEKNFKTNISDIESRREFESRVNDFIARTPDFPEYADTIVDWLEDHPDQYDIETAYDAVKGKALAILAKEEAEKGAAEAQKNLASNAGGGSSQGATIVKGTDEVIDTLIRNKSNPNVL